MRAQGDGTYCTTGAVEWTNPSVTFPVETDKGTVTITAVGAYLWDDECTAFSTDLEGAPAGISFPWGSVTFCLTTNRGVTTTVTVTAPSPFSRVFKTADEGEWRMLSDASRTPSTTFTYTLTDGSDLDENGERDGRIVDPIALGETASFTG